MFGGPQCPHCKNNFFELKENDVANANYKLFFVQCNQCGAPFAALEYYDSGALLKEQEQRLAQIENQIATITSIVSNIDRNVIAIARRSTSAHCRWMFKDFLVGWLPTCNDFCYRPLVSSFA